MREGQQLRLNFQNHGQNQRALGSLLVEEAFQVGANFLLDYAPIHFFFRRGLLDGAQDDLARFRDNLLAIFRGQKAARNDFRRNFHFPRMFVDGNDRHDYTVFRQMTAIANDYVLDFFERAGIDTHAARTHGLASMRAAVSRKFNRLAALDEEYFAGDGAHLLGQRSVAEELPVFSMQRNKIFGAHELEQYFHFFLARVTRHVNRRRSSAFVIDEYAPAEKVIDHTEDGFVVSGNNAGRQNHGIGLGNAHQPVVVDRDARHGRKRLGLGPAGEHNKLPGVESSYVLRTNHASVRHAQLSETMGNLDIVHHAAADDTHLASHQPRNVDYLLYAMDGAREARNNYFRRSRPKQFFQSNAYRSLGRSKPGTLDVRAVAEERQHSVLAIPRECMKIERLSVHRRRADFKISGMDDIPYGSADSECHTIDRAVGHMEILDLERSNRCLISRSNFVEFRGVERPMLFELLAHDRERELRAIHRDVKVAQNVGKRSDVVFVRVRENNSAYHALVLLQVGGIRDDDIDAEQLLLGKHQSGVNYDDVVRNAERHHVHSEFAQTA